MRMTIFLRKCIKWFYLLFALAAILVAVVVQAGRSFSHLLADYPQEVSSYLSDKLNAKVSIAAISAEWVGLKPMVDVRNLRIVSLDDKPIFALEHARMRLDLLGSFAHARLVWSNLQLDHVAVEFAQDVDGFWHIAGIPKRTDVSPSADLNPLIDMALLSRRIEFARTQLGFEFASGAKTTLSSPLLRMESDGDFHRLALEMDVAGKPKTLRLIAEGKGDPRRKETFSSKAFIQLNQFPTNEPIAAVTAFLLRGIKAEVQSQGALDASLWLSSRPQHEGFDLVGTLDVQRLAVPMLGRSLALDSFSTDVMGHWLYSGKWQLALQAINAKTNDQTITNLNFAASAASFADPVVLQVQHLDLAHLHQVLDGAGILGESKLRDTMRQLSPQGELHNLRVAIPTDNPRGWELQANIVQVGADAWHGVPALRKVDGMVFASQQGGYVDIDSHQGFSMHYSPTYAETMEFQQAKGRVAWWLQPDKNQIYVNSGALVFSNGEAEQAKGYMWLSLPWQRNSGDVDLYLQIGANNLNASLYRKYTPAVVPKALLTWLEKSIGPHNTGSANAAGFVFRGTLNNPNPAARSHQLALDINHAQLNYHPEWPALSEINGRLLVSDSEVFASVDSATLLNSQVGPTQISAHPNPDGHGSLLRVEGSVEGGADDGMRVLRESMLRRYIGANMDTWSPDGTMHTKLKLAVPLDPAGGGAQQQVDISLQSPHFDMGNLRLAMQNVSGQISFNETAGLSSEGLHAVLFGAPVSAQLSTNKQGDASQTRVEVAGEVDAKVLAKWTQRPEVLFLRGRLPYKAVVELNQKGRKPDPGSSRAEFHSNSTELNSNNLEPALDAQAFAVVKVNSSLAGVSVDLPAPYGKAPNIERPLQFTLSMFEHSSFIHLAYDNHVEALFELDLQQQNKLMNANIALGSHASLAAQPQFLVSGNLPGLDVAPWKSVVQQYLDQSLQLAAIQPKLKKDESDASPNNPIAAAPASNLVAGLPFHADVLLGAYQVGPLALTNIHVQAERVDKGWKIGFTNPLVVGELGLPDASTSPMRINLSALRLASKDLGLTKVSDDPADTALGLSQKATASIDPRLLPLADISVQALYMDDINYGNWALQIRPNDKGVRFANIHGSVKGVTVGALDGVSGGANMDWVITDAEASTHFVGQLSAGDIAVVLREWQKPDMLESQLARFKVDAMWAGDPQDFALKKMAGSIDIWLEKGRFKNTPSVSSDGLLRLMAVLNFDSLARRLRLDFSDLYKSGLAYDDISGNASFVPGTMTFSEPLSVKTPSSRLQLAGKFDLENEKVDARLVATLPVVGSYTFFTALVTGLPAAVGIYVASKLFKKQVDRATSISYRIQGSWSEPQMNFDRLFESEEDLVNSVTAKPVQPVKSRKRKPKK